jgi:hypothetical protein
MKITIENGSETYSLDFEGDDYVEKVINMGVLLGWNLHTLIKKTGEFYEEHKFMLGDERESEEVG